TVPVRPYLARSAGLSTETVTRDTVPAPCTEAVATAIPLLPAGCQRAAGSGFAPPAREIVYVPGCAGAATGVAAGAPVTTARASAPVAGVATRDAATTDTSGPNGGRTECPSEVGAAKLTACSEPAVTATTEAATMPNPNRPLAVFTGAVRPGWACCHPANLSASYRESGCIAADRQHHRPTSRWGCRSSGLVRPAARQSRPRLSWDGLRRRHRHHPPPTSRCCRTPRYAAGADAASRPTPRPAGSIRCR